MHVGDDSGASRLIGERTRVVEELRGEVRRLGGNPEDGGSFLGKGGFGLPRQEGNQWGGKTESGRPSEGDTIALVAM